MWNDSFKLFSKKIRRTFKFEKEILLTEMNYDDINENKLKDKKDEWLDNVKQNVLCNAFCYARYC